MPKSKKTSSATNKEDTKANNPKVVELTQSGLDELKEELKELSEVRLPAVVDRVARAREYGDLSENSEYHSARDEQQLIEARIDEIQKIISKAKVVKQTTGHKKVGLGSTVVVHPKDSQNKKITMEIVGEFEVDPGENKMSSISPMGKALMGKKKGAEVVVKAPKGSAVYVIDQIK